MAGISQEELLKKYEEKESNEIKRKELGLSKNQFKKLLKQEKFEATKTEYRKIQRDKRKKRKLEKSNSDDDKAEDKPEDKKKKFKIDEQTKTGVKFIIDCEFDDLMNDKEVNSLSNQITRIYSSKRICPFELPVTVSSFGGNLKKRFDKSIEHYKLWQNFDFSEENLSDIKKANDETNDYGELIYLTADTDEIIDTLEADKTYIIGGIVDKNRHKNLCINKAKELGIKVGKLPIDKYIEINGRQVLATSHVYEICCKWFEYRNWKDAFNEILPQRKLVPKQRVRGRRPTTATTATEPSDDTNVDNQSQQSEQPDDPEAEQEQSEN